eukprot:11646086-Alexandrium_andersonii.AAC.1
MQTLARVRISPAAQKGHHKWGGHSDEPPRGLLICGEGRCVWQPLRPRGLPRAQPPRAGAPRVALAP